MEQHTEMSKTNENTYSLLAKFSFLLSFKNKF